jgi:putative ABC transport system permease protein
MLLPRFLRITRHRLRAVSRQDALDAELDRELAFHLDQLAAEYVADGMTPDEARHAAKRALGNMPLVAEQCRDHRRVSWLHDFRRDVTYGLRMLVRNPTVSFVIVASLALGIGANTAVLGAIDAITRARVPVPDSERVLALRTYRQDGAAGDSPATIADYFAWAEENQSFESIGLSLGNQADFGDTEGMPAERILGVAVTAELFSVLRVTPALGRVYTDEEVRRAQPDVPIVLSHRLWQRRFGGTADVVGSRIRMNRRTAYVVGVMPEKFHYPGLAVDYWVPLTANRSDAQSPQRLFGVTARLKPGVSAQQAEADLNRIADHLAIERPDRHAGWSVRSRSIRDAMFGWTRQPLWTLEAAVALVLLVACTNVAGLLLARGVARRAEITVRAALGASRGRLVRQLVAETAVLAAAGGALGVLVAWFGVRTLSNLIPPPGAAGMVAVTLDARIVAIAALISIASGVIFGILPAVAGSRWDISELRRGRWREALVAAQIAVTFVLMIGAGLLTRSFLVVIARDVQFDPERLLTFQLNVPIGDFMHRRGVVGERPYFEITPSPALMFERVHEGLKAMPGADAVAGVSVPIVNALVVPMTEVRPSPTDPGAPSSTAAAETHPVAYFFVTPEFFQNIGARLLRGRDIGARDTVSSAWVVVVNESAARRLWPGGDPIGRQLSIVGVPEERPRQVVGVVADIPLAVPQPDARSVIYLSYLQQPSWYPLPGANLFGSMTFMVRTAGDPLTLVPAARRVVAAIDPERPLSSVGTMAQQLRARVPRRADYLTIISAFAAAALALAAIGIYGIVSYTAACRTREIGVRMALGARAADIVRLVGRRALLLVGVGVGGGLAGALALTQLLRSQLWEITPTDPVTYAAASALLLLVCTAACALPTRRATSVNPTIALRCE